MNKIKYIDIYINILDIFNFKITLKQQKLISAFFLDIYNNLNFEESFNLMLINANNDNETDFSKINLKNIINKIIITSKIYKNNTIIYNVYYTKNNIDKQNQIIHIIPQNLIKYKYKSTINNFKILNLYYNMLSINSGQFWGLGPKIYNELKKNTQTLLNVLHLFLIVH
jgi:hypothetical protein